MEMNQLVLEIEQQIEVPAAPTRAFAALLEQFTNLETMPMKLEPFPGGRWYRDLGNNAGHWWGNVQVIKPPTLLEICGPMFMSYPVSSHLQVRLTEIPAGTKVTLRHRAFGMIEENHRKGVVEGWQRTLSGLAAKLAKA